MNINLYAIILFLLLFANMSFAQNAAEDLSKVSKQYLNSNELSMDINVIGFKDKNDKKGTNIGEAMMRKKGNNYYSKFNADEMISNGESTLLFDHSEKSAFYFKTAGKRDASNMFSFNMDSILKLCDSVVFMGEKEGINAYSIYQRKSDITRTDLFIDNKTF